MRRPAFPLRPTTSSVIAGLIAALLTGCTVTRPGVVLTPDTISRDGTITEQYVYRPQPHLGEPAPEPVARAFPVETERPPISEDDAPRTTRGDAVMAGTPGVGLHMPRGGDAPLVRGLWSDVLLPADWEGYTTLVSRRRSLLVSFAAPNVPAETSLVAAAPSAVVLEKSGDRNWRYNNLLDGQTVSVGALDTSAPSWGNGVQLGGLQIASWPTGMTSVMPEGEFGFSSTVGGLASTTSTSTQGSYTTSAGSSSLRYGLTDDLTVESQVQSATSMNLVGLGGMYSLGSWGTISAGHAQSRYNYEQGHRVSLGYRYDASAFSVHFRNDYSTPGFADLAAYNDGTTANQRLSNSVRADVPVSGYGTISGTFVGLRDGASTSDRVGVLHSMSVTRQVSLGLGADRDIHTGDVSMHMNVSMPVEMFVGGLRLPFSLLTD